MADNDHRVVITDIDVPFGRLVVIFIKFVFAAIPAYIAVALIIGVIFAIFGGIFGGLGMMMGRY